MNPQNLRTDYHKGALDIPDASPDAIEQFSRWFDDAIIAKLPEPNAMILATTDVAGAPSARVMLLKGFDAAGFVFFTNYASRKSRDLSVNPKAALVFFWQPLERQVRIEGTIEKVTREESETYFHSRPRESQIGAWVSQQSSTVVSRAELEERQADLLAQFGDGPIPLPHFWGGFRLVPQRIEFWQGRPSRLHDRLLYSRQPDNSWQIQRLEP